MAMTALYRLLGKLLLLTVDLFRILVRIYHRTTTLTHQGDQIMAKIEDLQAVVTQIATDQAANAAAVSAEIARVEALIASLGTSGIDPALLDPIVAQLTSISAGLQATTATAAAERP